MFVLHLLSVLLVWISHHATMRIQVSYYMRNTSESVHVLSCTGTSAFLLKCLLPSFFAVVLLNTNLCRYIKV